jgi:NADPH-dependent curcumin reductase CurA
MTLISQKAKIEGFIVFDYEKRYQEGREAIGRMMRDGKLRYRYHFVEGGVDACVDGLKGLFEGANQGKT